MAKTQELRPDTVLKNYWNDNERFADIFNAVLFDGEQVIRPEELENVDTEESSVLEHRDYAVERRITARHNVRLNPIFWTIFLHFIAMFFDLSSHYP